MGYFFLLVGSLAKNLANTIFGSCNFFQVPKVALGENPLYIFAATFLIENDI